MKSKKFVYLLLFIGLGGVLFLGGCANAQYVASGAKNTTLPELSDIAVGVSPISGKVDLYGDQLAQSLDIAVRNQMSWLAIDLDWQEIWPEEYSPILTKSFDAFLLQAEANHLQVMISITNAPEWAMDENGPNAKSTAELIFRLTNTYSAINAVEVFPGANAYTGWGRTPDPVAYKALLDYVALALDVIGRDTKLIVGGFYPSTFEENMIAETVFLNQLYALGSAHLLEQVSLRYPAGSTQPGQPGGPAISRYEQLRFVMLQQNQQYATLWITSYTWPESIVDKQSETDFLVDSYEALQSHLYLETIVFDSLNPSSIIRGEETSSLIQRNGKLHPGVMELLQPSDSLNNISAGKMAAGVNP